MNACNLSSRMLNTGLAKGFYYPGWKPSFSQVRGFNNRPPTILKLARRKVIYCAPEGNDAAILNEEPAVEREGPEDSGLAPSEFEQNGDSPGCDSVESSIVQLKEMLKNAQEELDTARKESEELEAEAQKIAEVSVNLSEDANAAEAIVASLTEKLEAVLSDRLRAQENLEKAETSFSLAEVAFEEAQAELDSALRNVEDTEGEASSSGVDYSPDDAKNEQEASSVVAWQEAFNNAQAEINEKETELLSARIELERIEALRVKYDQQLAESKLIAKLKREKASSAEENVAQAMAIAERAVNIELEASLRVREAGLALERAEKLACDSDNELVIKKVAESLTEVLSHPIEEESGKEDMEEIKAEILVSAMPSVDFPVLENEAEAAPLLADSLPQLKTEEIPAQIPVFDREATRKQRAEDFSLPQLIFRSVVRNFSKLAVAVLLLAASGAFLYNKSGRFMPVSLPPSVMMLPERAKPYLETFRKLPARVQSIVDELPKPEVDEEEGQLLEVLWILFASVFSVFLFKMVPGGSPILAYLFAGVVIGPHGLGIIKNVAGTAHIAEFGVVFLMFSIGLEMSWSKLLSMGKFVMGLGSTQVISSTLGIAAFAHYHLKYNANAALVIGCGLALSSTAVVLQVLQERGESTSRHGRALMGSLLFQDLAVVVILILIPQLSPQAVKIEGVAMAVSFCLGFFKAAFAFFLIFIGGSMVLRPVYRIIANLRISEVLITLTLFVCLVASFITKSAGLSSELGAFLAGTLVETTDYHIQAESDINPFRGLLLGLFFVTVGMSVNASVLFAQFPTVLTGVFLLVTGKTVLVAVLGRFFGLSPIQAIRTGLLLAPGGEFAFVAFNEAVRKRILTPADSSVLFLVVGVSMALTPYLAILGTYLASRFSQHDVKSLIPDATDTDDLSDHVIICGFGRVGQLIAQLLSENAIPFVALDVLSDRVSFGRAQELPVYFGDAGSTDVLHKVGADRALAAIVALDTHGANYRVVWSLARNFPNVKTFARAHDMATAIQLEKAGATAVIPETLEPSLQLGAEVLHQMKFTSVEISSVIDDFRRKHLSELSELSLISGSSLGYGYSRLDISKAAPEEEKQGAAGEGEKQADE